MKSGKLEIIKEHITRSDIVSFTKIAGTISHAWEQYQVLRPFNTQSKFMCILLLMEKYYGQNLVSKADLATRMMDGGGSYDGHISFINECISNESFYEFNDTSDKRKKFIIPNRFLINGYEEYIKTRIMVAIGSVSMLTVNDRKILSEIKWEEDIEKLLSMLKNLPEGKKNTSEK